MRRYEIVHIFARRLNAKVGRVQAVLSKLQEAGTVSSPGDAKGHPIDMAEPEITSFLIALLGERGISSAAETNRTFGPLEDADGHRFDEFMSAVLFGPPVAIRHLMVRQAPAGVSVTVDGRHLLFGEPPSLANASPARIISGEALAAIAAELRGMTPEQADAAAALNQLMRSA